MESWTFSQFRYLTVSECQAAEAILLTVCDFTLNSMNLEKDPQWRLYLKKERRPDRNPMLANEDETSGGGRVAAFA